jgi:hypothetical protein
MCLLIKGVSVFGRQGYPHLVFGTDIVGLGVLRFFHICLVWWSFFIVVVVVVSWGGFKWFGEGCFDGRSYFF